MRYENAAIHKVFRRFHNFTWAKIFCPNHQKEFLEVATKMEVFFCEVHVIDEKDRKGYNKESP